MSTWKKIQKFFAGINDVFLFMSFGLIMLIDLWNFERAVIDALNLRERERRNIK